MSRGTRFFVYTVTSIIATTVVLLAITGAALHATNQDRTNHANFVRECLASGKQIINNNCLVSR